MAPLDEGRRRFLGGMLTAAGAALAAPLLQAAPRDDAPFWNAPRRLDLVRAQTGQHFNGTYWQNGQVDREGYPAVCLLMRDVVAKKVAYIDPRLLDLLCAIQAWVRFHGFGAEPMIIHSGYRTEQTNRNLEGAARRSQHLLGRAADITLPGLPATYVGRLAAHYAAGGVGFYPSRDFIHVDTGQRRFWVR
jgi:uncharacterized protein YcbK (DUF882 family)